MHTRWHTFAPALVVSLGVFLLPATSAAAETTFQLEMSGEQEVPPGDPDGKASGTLTIDDSANSVSWNFAYSGFREPQAMHIHAGKAGVAGGPVVPLNVGTSEEGKLIGTASADAKTIAAILAAPADYYVNIHTAEFRPGAVRGQLAK
jgi:hypothetical protein